MGAIRDAPEGRVQAAEPRVGTLPPSAPCREQRGKAAFPRRQGAEDGNVWTFDGVGERRTQALNIGLRGTAPFHWDGKLLSVGALMNEAQYQDYVKGL